MFRGVIVAAAVAGLMGAAGEANAVLLGGNFADLANPPGNNTPLGTSIVVNGVTIQGWEYDTGTGTYVPANLFVRDQNNDRGLGVCSTLDISQNAGACSPSSGGGGDFNELDNGGVVEIISLSIPSGTWTDFEVSSLDNGDPDGNEEGVLFWNANWSDPNVVLADGSTGFFLFSDATIGPIESSIFAQAVGGGFDPTSRSIFFASGDSYSAIQSGTPAPSGEENDYLVKSAFAVPEPATLATLFIGLLGAGVMLRRRRAVGD